MVTLATIGYEGASLDDFIATLRLAKIQTLLDIRELPISRRRGFAKTALSTALSSAGIEYVHLKGLGDPKEGREAARAKDFKGFVRIYSKHLKTAAAQQDLEHAIATSKLSRTCLMCYERDPNTCHRKLVAESISAIFETKIQHLGVKDGIGDQQRTRSGARRGIGKGPTTRGIEAR